MPVTRNGTELSFLRFGSDIAVPEIVVTNLLLRDSCLFTSKANYIIILFLQLTILI